MRLFSLLVIGLSASPTLVSAVPTPELTLEDVQLQVMNALEAATEESTGVAKRSCNLLNARVRKDWYACCPQR
jgi:hypothetical protein